MKMREFSRCYLHHLSNILSVLHYQLTIFPAIWYDTIRYIYVCSKADKMASLVYRTVQKQKRLRKNYKQKPISSEEMVQAKVREGSRLGGRSGTMGDRICETGRF